MENVNEVFWKWIDAEGGDYKVAKRLGKINGSFLLNARKRGAMPKLSTLQEMAKKLPGFPKEVLSLQVETTEPVKEHAEGFSSEQLDRIEDLLLEKDKRIDNLERQVATLERQLEFLQRIFPSKTATDAPAVASGFNWGVRQGASGLVVVHRRIGDRLPSEVVA